MKVTKQLIFVLSVLFSLPLVSYTQNVALDFDNNNKDFVQSNVAIGNNDFTVEMWFRSADNSTNQSCVNNFRRLFSFGGGTPFTRFEVGTCGGFVNIFWQDNTPSFLGPTQVSIPSYNDALWHHIAVTKNGQNVEIFLDCISVWTGAFAGTGGLNTTFFRLGRWPGGGATLGEWWWGRIDDVRIWDYAKTQTQVDNQKNCLLNGAEAGLVLNWTFDEGVANGSNAAITTVVDQSPNGNVGTLSGFTLLPVGGQPFGATSNFVNATSPIAYPALNDMTLEVRDYPYQNALLQEICNGDPAHFRILQDNMVPGPYANVVVQWYYDDGAGPLTLSSPPFTDFSFGVPQGNITYACASSTDGFVDRRYFAIATVTDPVTGVTCDYQSEDYDLRICCPISPATVDILPPDPLCEGETTTVNVCLNSPDLFVQTPGQYVDIEWYYDGSYIGFTDQTCFNYTLTAPLVTSPQQLCFEAEVTNCNGKVSTFESCLTVDPEPVCGSIIGWPQAAPLNITLVSSTPHLTYEICPGNDSQVGIDPADPFLDCIPQWQYSYDCTTWFDLGLSNTIQNTNIIPTSAWPGDEIFYRIQCNPLSNPSGCDPCFSDKIEIRLKDAPPMNAITGLSQLCKGDNNSLMLTTSDPTHSYTWYCDGLVVGTGPSYTYTADASACYWVETVDAMGCYLVTSPQFCVEVCEVVPLLSCPLPPNDCACLGDPITLSACDSYSTCPNPDLRFEWFINNVSQGPPSSSCTLTDTPPATGSNYKVIVTDLTTGCFAETDLLVIPCDKDQ